MWMFSSLLRGFPYLLSPRTQLVGPCATLKYQLTTQSVCTFHTRWAGIKFIYKMDHLERLPNSRCWWEYSTGFLGIRKRSTVGPPMQLDRKREEWAQDIKSNYSAGLSSTLEVWTLRRTIQEVHCYRSQKPESREAHPWTTVRRNRILVPRYLPQLCPQLAELLF